MADNFQVNTGTGPTIATEDVGGAQYQKIRLNLAASGAASILTVGAKSGTSSVPVVLAVDQATVPVNVTAFTPSGTQNVSVVNTPTITVGNSPVVLASQSGAWSASMSGTGTVLIAGTPTVTASQGGTWNIATVSTVGAIVAMPVLSATNVTIASIATGSVSIVNAPVVTATISNPSLAVINTAHASRYDAYAIATTATGTILKTSGAHTIFVTDLLFSVDVPMNVTWNSATTAKGTVYLATKGGMVVNLRTPIVCNSAESLTFTPSASGSCAAMACGYTVT